MRVKEIRVILRKAADLLERNEVCSSRSSQHPSPYACHAIAKAAGLEFRFEGADHPAAIYLKALVAPRQEGAWLGELTRERKAHVLRLVASGHEARVSEAVRIVHEANYA